MLINWNDYPNFSENEFKCKSTGKCEMDAFFLLKLQNLRNAYNKPLIISSGYRHPTHPVEAKKDKPGTHTLGRAVDILIYGKDALHLLQLACKMGFTGFGLGQKGNILSRIIHLDDLNHSENRPRPWIWTY
jgi:uncharacterized protein YcbK (DUF882 family)